MEGKLLLQNPLNSMGGKVNQKINLSHLPAGTYVLQIKNGSETSSHKLIIRK